MGNQIAWGYQHEDTDQEGSDIECYDEQPVDFHWYRTDIVGLGIQLDESGMFLDGQNRQCYQVSENKALADDKHGKPKEGMADRFVAGAQCLHHAYHGSAL